MSDSKRPKRKPMRDEDRFVAAMQGVDNAIVFLCFAVVPDEQGTPRLRIFSSDDYSGARLLQDGCPQYDAEYSFGNELDVPPTEEPDHDEEDDEL
jgi:hypothetical protein